jgi:hypothetical protein
MESHPPESQPVVIRKQAELSSRSLVRVCRVGSEHPTVKSINFNPLDYAMSRSFVSINK